MKKFHLPIGPVQFESVGQVIDKLTEQGFDFVQMAYFGSALVRPKVTLPGNEKGVPVVLYMLLMTYEADKIEDVPQPDLK